MAISQATLELLIALKDQASAGLDSLGSALGNVGAIAGGVALAGVVAFGAALAGGVGDAQEARQLYASTEQTITTMGNAAGRSADQVVDLASSLSDAAGKSLFGDDQIQQSENLLLTFGNIKGETFDLATALTVDLAQALGGAPKDQAMALGKALDNPSEGYKALSRAGLTFSDDQIKMMKTMQDAGDIAGAQAIMLEALNKQVGGQAQAAAQAAGGMVQFKAGLGEAFETLGSKLLPVLDKFGAWLNSPEVQQNIGIFAERLGRGIEIAATFLVDDLIPALEDLYNWLAPILGPVFAEIGRALAEDLPRGIERVTTAWNTMKQALSDFNEGYIQPIVRGWNAVTTAVSDAYAWFEKIGSAIGSISIPSWLQGHSPPPLANWFSDIATSAESAGGAVESVLPTGGAVPSLPAFAGAGGAGGTITINLTVMGSVKTEQDLIVAVRNGLRNLGQQNTSIFGSDVTP